jgi:ABC-2 type transport system ATP-binding protein
MSAIKVTNLKKSYSEGKEILHGINFEIKKGEFVGMLGSNGAGKTTTINCISGISKLSAGKIEVFGHDVRDDYQEARSMIGLSPQEWTVDIFETVESILYYRAGFFGITGDKRKERIEEMLNIFELQEHRKKKFNALSGGLKRRLVLAKALMHDPKILILDEPTAGVDVETRRSVWDYIKKIHKEGKTIILTSHYLEEIEELCDRVIIIKKGDIVLDKSMTEIKELGKLESLYLETTKD